MSTSANVIEYTITHKDTGKQIYHRQNIMCKINTTKLLALEHPEDYIIQPWGYDEEEELWEGKEQELVKWLKDNPNEFKENN